MLVEFPEACSAADDNILTKAYPLGDGPVTITVQLPQLNGHKLVEAQLNWDGPVLKFHDKELSDTNLLLLPVDRSVIKRDVVYSLNVNDLEDKTAAVCTFKFSFK